MLPIKILAIKKEKRSRESRDDKQSKAAKQLHLLFSPRVDVTFKTGGVINVVTITIITTAENVASSMTF
jgi:hypothetical protein